MHESCDWDVHPSWVAIRSHGGEAPPLGTARRFDPRKHLDDTQRPRFFEAQFMWKVSLSWEIIEGICILVIS